MRILMLPRYGRTGANSRYRLWQYLPLFEGAGHQVDCIPMLDDEYLARLYRTGTRSAPSLLSAYGRQLSRLLILHKYQAVLLDQELFPYLPGLLEQLACRIGGRTIVDYDDAAYWKYTQIPILRRKIGVIMRSCHTVVVGNRHLARYAEPYSHRVRVIPTVVDVNRYSVHDYAVRSDTVRICWIGTPITANLYLPLILPSLKTVQKRFPTTIVRIIGTDRLAGTEDLRVEFEPWSEESETRLVSQCDIGIMPLPDSEFQRGKCGLKLIQYMAAGLPTVASPVGENQFIVDHARTGFHAATPEQWVDHLSALITNSRLRAQMGEAGRAKAEAQYSLEVGTSLWIELLREIEIGELSPLSSSREIPPAVPEPTTRDQTA